MRFACASQTFRHACRKAIKGISVSFSELAGAQQLQTGAHSPVSVDARPLLSLVRLAGSSLTEFSMQDISSGSRFHSDGGAALLNALSEVAVNLSTLRLLAPANSNGELLRVDGAFSSWHLKAFLQALPASVHNLHILQVTSSSCMKDMTRLVASKPNKFAEFCLHARGPTDSMFAMPLATSDAESRFTVVKVGTNLRVVRLGLCPPVTSESFRTLHLLASKCPQLRYLELELEDDGGESRKIRRALAAAIEALSERGFPLSRLTLRGIPVTTSWVRDTLSKDRVTKVHLIHCAGVNAAALHALPDGSLAGLETGLDELDVASASDVRQLEALSVVDHGDSGVDSGVGSGVARRARARTLQSVSGCGLRRLGFSGNSLASRAGPQTALLDAAACWAGRLEAVEVVRVHGAVCGAALRLVRAAGPTLRRLALRRCGPVLARARAAAAGCARLEAVQLWEAGAEGPGADGRAVLECARVIVARNARLQNRARFLRDALDAAPAEGAGAGTGRAPGRKRRRVRCSSDEEE